MQILFIKIITGLKDNFFCSLLKIIQIKVYKCNLSVFLFCFFKKPKKNNKNLKDLKISLQCCSPYRYMNQVSCFDKLYIPKCCNKKKVYIFLVIYSHNNNNNQNNNNNRNSSPAVQTR